MSKIIEDAIVVANDFVARNTFLLRLLSPRIASLSRPGQFCEMKVNESNFPFLRRPFSISNVCGNEVEFLVDIVGEGTRILSELSEGNKISVMGPLGNGFGINTGFEEALIIGGGIGVAPFPFLEKELRKREIGVTKVYGFANKDKVPAGFVDDSFISTDDGSEGFRGNAIQLAQIVLRKLKSEKIKAFACGPLPMLKASKEFANKNEIELEISVEGIMACGIGLCQGCPIPKSNGEGYLLICKDGPVFNANDIEV